MKITELMTALSEIKSQTGDIDVLGVGHPGEIGSEPRIEIENKLEIDRGQIISKKELAVFLVF